MKKKGVIVELKGKQKVILGDNGRFYVGSVKKGDYIGGRVTVPSSRRLTAAFSAVLFVLAAAGGGYIAVKEINSYAADTLIRIEINTSVEFLVNGRGNVVSSAPLNSDAAALITDKDYNGMSIADAASDFALLALSCGFLNLSADCNAVFIYSLNDSKQKEEGIFSLLKQKIEKLFEQYYIKAVVVNSNSFSCTAEGSILFGGNGSDRFRAVYTVGRILERNGDKRSFVEILQEYKNSSVKNMCNIIRQAHIKYNQSINDEEKLLFYNTKMELINKNKNNIIGNTEKAASYRIWLQSKRQYEQSFSNNTGQTALPLYYAG